MALPYLNYPKCCITCPSTARGCNPSFLMIDMKNNDKIKNSQKLFVTLCPSLKTFTMKYYISIIK